MLRDIPSGPEPLRGISIMSIQPISAVQLNQHFSAATREMDAYRRSLSAIPLSGAHLALGAPEVGDRDVQESLTLRGLGQSISHGMRSSFTSKPMTELTAAVNANDTYGMTIALANLTEAANTVGLFSKMAAQVSQGIKSLTTQSG